MVPASCGFNCLGKAETGASKPAVGRKKNKNKIKNRKKGSHQRAEQEPARAPQRAEQEPARAPQIPDQEHILLPPARPNGCCSRALWLTQPVKKKKKTLKKERTLHLKSPWTLNGVKLKRINKLNK